MSYLVTGATGFIGRHLVEQLLANQQVYGGGEIHVLVRKGSRTRLERLLRSWGDPGNVLPVAGDLTAPMMGLDEEWIERHAGHVEHFVHLAGLYDITSSAERNRVLNLGGTRAAVDLAHRMGVERFHHLSSVAVAGDHRGAFDETMFDVGQALPSPYHRITFDAERLVRDTCQVPWRVYRTATVVGHSQTGEMDKVDGLYYFFPALKRLRDTFPRWTPLVGVDLGDTNVVPVDYVARSMTHLMHSEDHDGETFHLVHPGPQPTMEVLNTLAEAAQAPRVAVPVDRSLLGPLRRPAAAMIGSRPAQAALRRTLGALGVPAEVLRQLSMPTTFASRSTERALSGSGVVCSSLDTYAGALWDYWEQHLDATTAHDSALRRALQERVVVITGASSGIGRATALKVSQAGGTPLLVARGKDELEETRAQIEAGGGVAHIYPCDLTDLEAIDALATQIREDHSRIDFVVNNAGRSIRRSLNASSERFHDFERTMALNYFGAVRLVIGLLPAMTSSGAGGHVVNISTIGVQTNPPRFSAYVASKAALDAWSRVVSSELVDDGVTFTTIRMPLVRTPMIAPTRIYEAFPTITPAQAADLVLEAMKNRPHEVSTHLGTLAEVTHAIVPSAAFRIRHLAYQVFPGAAAAQDEDAAARASSEQLLLARLLKGVHW